MDIFCTSSFLPLRLRKAVSLHAAHGVSVGLMVTAMALFIFCLSCSSAEDPPESQGLAAFKPGPEDLDRLTPLMVVSAHFKETARSDFVKAMLTHADDNGRERLSAIDNTLWHAQQSQFAWMLFFNSAVRVYGGTPGQFPVVGYYNPFSDTFLLTVWAANQNVYRMVDAEMLMGDWIRDQSPDLDLVPLWLREQIHRPMALGVSVANSLLAFERVFASADINNWRDKINILGSPELLEEINYPGAAMMLNDRLINVLNFSAPDEAHIAFKACSKHTVDLLQSAGNGHIDRVLSQADQTLAETASGLKALSGSWYSAFKVSSALLDPSGCLVLLSSPEQTSGSLSLYFMRSNNQYRIKRIDYVDYQHFYNQLKFQRMQPQQGGAQ